MRRDDIRWPAKHDVFGVDVSAVDYEGALRVILTAAEARRSAIVDHMPVHGLMEAVRDPTFRAMVNSFEIVAPDGQPVRWALNALCGASLMDRVYGPEFMLQVCRAAATRRIGVYLLGSLPPVLERLQRNLRQRFRGLEVVGSESPPFRELTDDELRATARRIEESGAGIVFVGLGCPKQERYAYRLRELAGRSVFLCVGAAFDFHAGTKRMAPPWLQDRGLEWLFRLASEPRRLWRRYLVTNTLFLMKFLPAYLGRSVRGRERLPANSTRG